MRRISGVSRKIRKAAGLTPVRKWILRGFMDRNMVPLTLEVEDDEGEDGIRCSTDNLAAQVWMVDHAADPRTPPPAQNPRTDPVTFRKSSRRLFSNRRGGSAPKPQSPETRKTREEFAEAGP